MNPGHKRLVVAITVAYWVLLFVATHLPAERVVLPNFSHSDLVVHFVAYLVLGLVVCLAWPASSQSRARASATSNVERPRRWPRLVLILIVLLAYAAFDEISQGPVGRSPELSDWLADLAGVCCAIGLFSAWQRRRFAANRPG
ncbi:MAG: VanZ family protein [Deltaproteobacteria bacterium]|nr:VanZ family protein [Deltaproteobacteria bacterium]